MRSLMTKGEEVSKVLGSTINNNRSNTHFVSLPISLISGGNSSTFMLAGFTSAERSEADVTKCKPDGGKSGAKSGKRQNARVVHEIEFMQWYYC